MENLVGFEMFWSIQWSLTLGQQGGEVYMPCLCLTKKRYGGLAYVGTLSDAGRMGQRSNFRAITTADLGWFLGDVFW